MAPDSFRDGRAGNRIDYKWHAEAVRGICVKLCPSSTHSPAQLSYQENLLTSEEGFEGEEERLMRTVIAS